MSKNDQEETSRQSPGSDPTSSSSVVNGNKRNSGLFSFFKWFRSSSRESVNSQNSLTPNGSCESLNSTGTVASFSFVAPAAYKAQSHNQQKCLNPGPETDTYKARLKQRDKIRERDLAKNITLRKKYNLFFSRDTLFGNKNNKRNKNDETRNAEEEDEDNSKSLPLMTKKMEDGRGHRRTNSDSSKGKKSGAYLHVKGKRKAPQPPHNIPHHHHHHQDNNSTLSLRRKKRLAPQPPPPLVTADKVENTLKNTQAPDDNIEYADVEAVLTNDSLKLDHGVLKQTRHPLDLHPPKNSSIQSDLFAAPVSPKPWYKRNISKKSDNKYEPIAPAINNKKEDRKSNNIMFLTNISELDREAGEIMRKDKLRSDMKDIPEFLKPRQEQQDQQIISKRKSAKDLIAKFNAITNVTKVTVNSAFFGGGNNNANKNKEYFGPKKFDLKNNNDSSSINNNIGVDNKFVPLAKCETSACIIKPSNASTPKMERKNWLCPKCKLENDYWRIICHVCSTIKPYFDDLTTSKPKNIESAVDPRAQFNNNKEIKVLEVLETSSSAVASSSKNSQSNGSNFNGIKRLPQLERSRTQINFTHQDVKLKNKDDEREKLKKMLIEMKNSLPKRKSQCLNNAKRKSTIHEDAEIQKQTQKESQMEKEETAVENPNINVTKDLKLQEIDVKIAEKEKEVNQMKPVAMTKETDSKNFLLMRPKDFEDIYSEKTGLTKVQHHCYANTAGENLFLNVPTEKLAELKNGFKDTLEINRLLKRLETAIVKGNLNDAAIFASELAQLKVNCSVIRQKNQHVGESSHADAIQNSFTVDMYVEDRLSHRGPFPLHVTQKQTVLELKQQVEREFDIPVNVQRWILGKELASSDQSTLESHNILKDGCPIFLYLVVPQKDQQKTAQNPNLEAGPSKNLTEPPKVQELSKTVLPKIVGEQLKVHIMIKPSPAPSNNQQPIPINANKAVESNKAPKAVQEDFSEYEKTLKANKTWECEACTLINPNTSNMCLVCSTGRPKNASPEITRRQKKKQSKKHYYELMNLDQNDLVTNSDTFECLICLLEIAPKDGVTLRECLHQFCKICLANTIEFCDEAEVKCPYRDDQYSCDTALQDREVKALVTKNVYDQFLAKSVSQAENKIDKSFHCKTPDCTGWCIFEDNTNEFTCPVCKKTSCLTCQAIHMGLNCKQYQERMNAQSGTDEDAKRTREWLEEMVEKGEALTCPACHVILMKKWGCDWVRCTMCKTEICWVTRGLRWGPGGKGDTSGGCKCGLNGIKCHAKCNYCH